MVFLAVSGGRIIGILPDVPHCTGLQILYRQKPMHRIKEAAENSQLRLAPQQISPYPFGKDCHSRSDMITANYDIARYNMAYQQIRPWDVWDDLVLDVMQELPREQFVPHAYRSLAFADTRIPLGHGELMMEPKMEARMLQALAVNPSDQVLEIGTGSGFVTACLARLGNAVSSYDIHDDFIQSAEEKLAMQGINNVHLNLGNGFTAELPKEGFDVIAVTGSLPEYSDKYEQFLAPGGRLFMVVGGSPVMEAMLITRHGEEFIQDHLFETDLPPLKLLPQPSRFSF